jgi:lysine 6-dehydrogenase
MRYAVLGAGRQGVAVAYDLARHGEARALTLVEAHRGRLAAAVARLARLTPRIDVKAVGRALKGREATTILRGHDAVVSALPYRFNAALARAAVRARVSFCDMGGNTDIVKEELELAAAAKRAGVAVVPDCGLAPGLNNVLASIAYQEVEGARHVRMYCGGLPVPPRGPLGYSILFSIAGLTNEYMGEAVVLRGGKIRRIEAFTEVEDFRGPRELGPLEAFLTSGGTSLAPWTFRRKLTTYDYKTVRYRGHWEKVRAMIELGLLDLEPVRVGNKTVVPRDVFHAVAGPHLEDPKVRDVALLQVDCTDRRGHGVRYRMTLWHDRRTGFTAMEQGTGYPTAVVAHALARRELKPGAYTPERAGFGKEHVTALRRRGLKIRRTRLG